MAITTAAVIALGITAAASAYSARQNKKASEAQAGSTDRALGFQQEQGARADAAYQERMQIWNASRQALLDKYDIDIAPPTMGAPGGATGTMGEMYMAGGGVPSPPGGPAPPPPPGAMPRGLTPGMAQAKGVNPMEGRSLGQLASSGGGRGAWNDWGTMGLRGGGNA